MSPSIVTISEKQQASKNWSKCPVRSASKPGRDPRRLQQLYRRRAVEKIATQLADATWGAGRVELDRDDRDGQTLLVWYPSIEHDRNSYIKPAVRIESGAKSALDPNQPAGITPYLADDVADLDLTVSNVTTITAERTFWDKIVIAHGLRRWFERRGVLRNEGQRISRHYYDLHRVADTEVGKAAMRDPALGADCVRHARMFFNRPDFDLASAAQGTFALAPIADMRDSLRRDYAAPKR